MRNRPPRTVRVMMRNWPTGMPKAPAMIAAALEERRGSDASATTSHPRCANIASRRASWSCPTPSQPRSGRPIESYAIAPIQYAMSAPMVEPTMVQKASESAFLGSARPSGMSTASLGPGSTELCNVDHTAAAAPDHPDSAHRLSIPSTRATARAGALALRCFRGSVVRVELDIRGR
jgi:hypothetical protein